MPTYGQASKIRGCADNVEVPQMHRIENAG
jgi:hypothetical protein